MSNELVQQLQQNQIEDMSREMSREQGIYAPKKKKKDNTKNHLNYRSNGQISMDEMNLSHSENNKRLKQSQKINNNQFNEFNEGFNADQNKDLQDEESKKNITQNDSKEQNSISQNDNKEQFKINNTMATQSSGSNSSISRQSTKAEYYNQSQEQNLKQQSSKKLEQNQKSQKKNLQVMEIEKIDKQFPKVENFNESLQQKFKRSSQTQKQEEFQEPQKKNLQLIEIKKIQKEKQFQSDKKPNKLWEFYHKVGTPQWVFIFQQQKLSQFQNILKTQQINSDKFVIISPSECKNLFSCQKSKIKKWYKIVTDLSCLNEIKTIKYQRIDEINLLIEKKDFDQANQQKNKDQRIKKLSFNLKDFIKAASKESQNQEPFIFSLMLGSQKENIQQILSKNMTICAALKLKEKQLKKYFIKFVLFIKSFLIQPQKQVLNPQVQKDIEQYRKLFENDLQINKNSAIKFLQFYQKSNFLAKMIKFATNTNLFNLQQTQNLLYLLHQTYHSFKYISQNIYFPLKVSTKQHEWKECYHGLILKLNQFKQFCFQSNRQQKISSKKDYYLKANGSISASKQLKVALDHLKIKSQQILIGERTKSDEFKKCILVIHYKKSKTNLLDKQLSGGFFQNPEQFVKQNSYDQYQVIFNMMSDFKFLQIEEVSITQQHGLMSITQNYTKIHLQYNSIFNLIQQKKQNPGKQNTMNQKQAIWIFQNFWSQMKNFKDLGQLYLYLKFPKLALEYYRSYQHQQPTNYNILKISQCLRQIGKEEEAHKNLENLIKNPEEYLTNEFEPKYNIKQFLEIYKKNFQKNPFQQNIFENLIQTFIFSQKQDQKKYIHLLDFFKYYIDFFKQEVFEQREKIISIEPENSLIQIFNLFFIKQKTEQQKRKDAETTIQIKDQLYTYQKSKILVFKMRTNILDAFKSILEQTNNHIKQSEKYLKAQRQQLCKNIIQYKKSAPEVEKKVLMTLLLLNGSKQHSLTLQFFEEFSNNQQPALLQAHNVLIKDFVSYNNGNNLNQIPQKGKQIVIDYQKVQRYILKFIQNQENLLNNRLQQCNYNVRNKKYVQQSVKFAQNLIQFKKWKQSLSKLKALVKQNQNSKNIEIVNAYLLMSKVQIELGNIGHSKQYIQKADMLYASIKNQRKGLISDEIKVQQVIISIYNMEYDFLRNENNQNLHQKLKQNLQIILKRLLKSLNQNIELAPMLKQQLLLAQIYKLKATIQPFARKNSNQSKKYNEGLSILKKLFGNYSLEVMKFYIQICKTAIKYRSAQYNEYLNNVKQILGCYRQKKEEVISTPQFWYYHATISQYQLKIMQNNEGAYQLIKKALQNLRQTDEVTIKKLRLYEKKFKLAINQEPNQQQLKSQINQLRNLLRVKISYQKDRWNAAQRQKNRQKKKLYNQTKDLKIHYAKTFLGYQRSIQEQIIR